MKPIRIADFLRLSDEEIINHIKESGFVDHLDEPFLKTVIYDHQRSLTIFEYLKLVGVDHYDKVEKKPKPFHIYARLDTTMINHQQRAFAPILVFYKPKMSGEDKIVGITFYPSGVIVVYNYFQEWIKQMKAVQEIYDSNKKVP